MPKIFNAKSRAFGPSSAWDEVKVLVNGQTVARGKPIHLLRGQNNDLEVEVPDDFANDLRLAIVDSGSLNLPSDPPYEKDVPVIQNKAKWSIAPNDSNSGGGVFLFYARDVVQTLESRFVVTSAQLSDEIVKIQADGKDMPASGLVFFRGIPQAITAIPHAEAPIEHLMLSLDTTPLPALEPEDLVVTKNGPLEWTVVASNNSGKFRTVLSAESVPGKINFPVSRVLSTNLADDVTLLVDEDEMPSNGMDLIVGQTATLDLHYKNGDVLVGLPLAYGFIPVSGVEEGDFHFQPSLGGFNTKHQLLITGRALKQGEFKLKLFTAGERAVMITPTNRLSPGYFFRFMTPIPDIPYPLPPASIDHPVSIYFTAAVVLRHADGTPAGDIDVTFEIPEIGSFKRTTTPEGVAYLSNLARYETIGVRKLRAEAMLPSGKADVEAWLNVKKY